MNVPDEVERLRRVDMFDSNMSTERSVLTGARIGPLAFAGFFHVSTSHLFDRRGRQKISVAWGEQAIDGIKHDSVELVRDALRREFSNPNERLEASGPAGAPFSFANAGIFTQEQMDRVVDDLKLRTRNINAKTKRFISEKEWLSIDQALGETGTYAKVFMSKATGGDTGLHIAIALGRLRAAQVFVEEGCDVTILNDEGVCAVSILSDNFEKVMKLVMRIAQLEEVYSRRGATGRRLSVEEKACLAQQERVVKKANEYRLFGHGLACYFVDRLSGWLALHEEERACEIEGREMHPAAQQELRLCQVMCRYLEQCEAIRDREHDTLPQLTPEDLESKAERFTGIFTPARRLKGRGRRRRPQGSRGGMDNQVRASPTVGANANLATRFGLCTASSRGSPWGDEDDDEGRENCKENTDNTRQRQRQQQQLGDITSSLTPAEKAAMLRVGGCVSTTATTMTSVTSVAFSSSLTSSSSSPPGTRTSGGKGIAARLAAAQQPTSTDGIMTTNSSEVISKDTHQNPSDSSSVAARTVATDREGGDESSVAGSPKMPFAFTGRSLMSADWVSKPGGGGGKRGHNRYATKGLTPRSWTATKDTSCSPADDPSTSSNIAYMPMAGSSQGGQLTEGDMTRWPPMGSGGKGTYEERKRAGAAGLTNSCKRGQGRGWEGLYQIRPFDDTPE